MMQDIFAQQQGETLFLPLPGKQKGTATHPQSMQIWIGRELPCYARRYKKQSPVTGAAYCVDELDQRAVNVRFHPDYAGKQVTVGRAPAETSEADD